MSRSVGDGHPVGTISGRSLRDELASLKIERGRETYASSRRGGGGGGGGRGVLSLLLWLIPLSLLGAAGYFGYQQYDKLKPKVEVSVALVQAMTTGEAEKLLSAKGYLKSRHQALVGTKIAGRVEKLLFEEGDKVTKGQLLAVLEHNDTGAMLESRQAMVQKAEAELKEAISDREEKERQARRQAKLVGQKYASVEEADKAFTARDMASARVAKLTAEIASTKAGAHEVEEAIRNMHVVAPFEGTVITREAQLGETVSNLSAGGSNTRSAIAMLADLDRMEVETDVAEGLLSRLTIGQPAEISVSAVPDKHYRGRLRSIIPMGDRARGTVKVKVEILDTDGRLFPELVATVHFLPTHESESAPAEAGQSSLFVTKNAVVEEGGHFYAWVVDRKSRAHKKRIEVVVTKDELARVEAGLEAGESVVINPPNTLHEDELVKVAD
jgi:RND family efflux transporter MFP subunit